MTFDRAWVLALAWIPLAWGYFEYRRTPRKLGLALKVATFTLILLALGAAALEHLHRESSGGRAGGHVGQRVATRSGARFESGVGSG